MVLALGGRPCASSVAFVCALNMKQMNLYLAPAIFCYLLADASTSAALAPRSPRSHLSHS